MATVCFWCCSHVVVLVFWCQVHILLSPYLYILIHVSHSLGWLGRCVACIKEQQVYYDEHNARAKEKRYRIKQYEINFLKGKDKVQINSHDLVARPLFARLAQRIKAGSKIDVVEELRKIAVKVDSRKYISCR